MNIAVVLGILQRHVHQRLVRSILWCVALQENNAEYASLHSAES